MSTSSHTTPSKPLGALAPAASRLARRAGGYATLARVGAEALGLRLRDGRMAAARRAVDPEGQLAPEERERRAEAHVKAQRYRSLAHAQQVNAEQSARQARRAQRQARTPEAKARATAQTAQQAERTARTTRQMAYWNRLAEPDVCADAAAEAALFATEADHANEEEASDGGN